MPCRLMPLLALIVLTFGCASNKPTPKPQPQTIHLRSDASVSNPVPGGPLMKKALFNLVVSNQTITVNGVKVRDLQAVEKLLAEHQKPAITIATHKCLDRDKAVEVMTLAQRYTDTPIAFGSFGKFDDPECAK